jgi:hypothetical protein
MRRIIASMMAMFALASAAATELTPLLSKGDLGVVLADVRFPASLDRDLMSGLTNRLLIRTTLEHTGRRVQRSTELAIRYDLWDERFTIETRLDGIATVNTTLAGVQEVRAYLRRLRFANLYETADLNRSTPLIVTAELLLNPIDRERMENIKKWVAENSTRASLDPAGALGANDASLANALFNKIFEQYASGSDVAAIWQQRHSTLPFTLDALTDDER